MKTLPTIFAILFTAALLTVPSFAQQTATSPAGQPSAADMQKVMQQMTELAKTNENHKLLADTTGTWSYTVKMWMGDPNAKPQESKGTAVRKSMMDGRYVVGDYTGQMMMPGPDGKMKTLEFKGHGTEGYDNVKKKFVTSWIDNMGTGIEFFEGSYDPATSSITYTSEVEPVPGMKSPVREVIKLAGKDHMTLEWYENHGGQEAKTMEINYTRKK
jgi:hypothetical protein